MNEQQINESSDEIARLKAALTKNESYINLLQERLVEVNQTRDKFLSILSHDLRSPMTTLLGIIDLMEKGQLSNQELNFIMPNLKINVQSVLTLIDDLLSWSLRNYDKELTKNIVNLNLLVQDAYSIYSMAAFKKQIILDNQCRDDIFFEANYNMIRFVLRNLIGNALKFSLRFGKIITSSQVVDNHIKISVIDQGIGMNNEQVEKLFKGISDSIPGTENEKGTGLGLYISKEYLDLLNGSIEVKSKLSEGTTFTITIPKTMSSSAAADSVSTKG